MTSYYVLLAKDAISSSRTILGNKPEIHILQGVGQGGKSFSTETAAVEFEKIQFSCPLLSSLLPIILVGRMYFQSH